VLRRRKISGIIYSILVIIIITGMPWSSKIFE